MTTKTATTFQDEIRSFLTTYIFGDFPDLAFTITEAENEIAASFRATTNQSE